MAKSVDEATVRHVANLARLGLTDEEIARFADQLSAVVDYFEQLNELDTSGIPPTAHTLPVSNVFRDDVVQSSWQAARPLKNAPDHTAGLFRVPKVLGGDD